MGTSDPVIIGCKRETAYGRHRLALSEWARTEVSVQKQRSMYTD
jgi:hypothetical protein